MPVARVFPFADPIAWNASRCCCSPSSVTVLRNFSDETSRGAAWATEPETMTAARLAIANAVILLTLSPSSMIRQEALPLGLAIARNPTQGHDDMTR